LVNLPCVVVQQQPASYLGEHAARCIDRIGPPGISGSAQHQFPRRIRALHVAPHAHAAADSLPLWPPSGYQLGKAGPHPPV